MKAKVVRYDGWVCLYRQGHHDNHLETPKRGLKVPAKRFIQENSDKTRKDLLIGLKARNYHNTSKDDQQNLNLIKGCRERVTKKQAAERIDMFKDLQSLKDALDGRCQDVPLFLAKSNLTVSGMPLTVDTDSPLHKLIVLDHDVDVGSRDWSKITFAFPSARNTLSSLSSLWGTGQVQLEIDYSVGLWKDDELQEGMVGVSDADRVFHPIIFSIQRSEDGPGSEAILSLSCDMVTRSVAVPLTCLKDGAEVLHYGAKHNQLIDIDCFAHMMKQPFKRGGGLRGSQGSLARYLLDRKDSSGKCVHSLADVFDILSIVMGIACLTSIPDYVMARLLFRAKNPDLTDHFMNRYVPRYPTFGSACHPSGEAKSGQGLEKTWDYHKKSKTSYQKREKSTDVKAIVGAWSERESIHSNETFATVPTISKADWDFVALRHNQKVAVNQMSAAYYLLEDGRPLSREEAIGNTIASGGFVIYIPNNAYSMKWKEDSVKHLTGTSTSAGLTVQQMYHAQSVAKDTTCISVRPTEAKVLYLKTVGNNLAKNTPSPLPDENCRSFVLRHAQRALSENQAIKRNSSNKKRKKGDIADQRQLELEMKKWGNDVELEYMKEMEQSLPKDPTKDDDEHKEFHAMLKEHASSKPRSKLSGPESKTRRNRICGRGLGQFKEVIVTKSGEIACNCEHCLTDGYCFDTLIYNLVINKAIPPLKCREVDGIPWERVRAKWTEQLMTTLFEEEDEQWHKNNMLQEYLPSEDPCFRHVSKIESVPAPWSPRLGFTVSKQDNQVKVLKKDCTSRAKVLVGDTILKIGNIELAGADGNLKSLFSAMTVDQIAKEISKLSHKEIVVMDVLHSYHTERVARCTGLFLETEQT